MHRSTISWPPARPTVSTEDRWNFIRKNYLSDARADLETVKVPVLLIIGGQDVNVDVADTERVYRELLDSPGQLVVKKYPDATHSIVDKDLEDSEVRSALVAVLAPPFDLRSRLSSGSDCIFGGNSWLTESRLSHWVVPVPWARQQFVWPQHCRESAR